MSRAEKTTVSLTAPLLKFLTEYQERHRLSESEVIEEALNALREVELARAYRESGAELEADPLFDLESGHGLIRDDGTAS
ncbi:hypothetical protein [Deinococcus sp.]|uniref:hypothetical protein n=1 Tax=Deinococcus sp. TaxID=47478 RepID=UPI0025E491D3|nr:hypothetical protein [Deinococcus sp.]